MKKRFSKKGVSPLIATVLLISFAVALGAIVMSWGRNYVQDVTEDTYGFSAELKCDDVMIDIVNIGGRKDICYTGNAIQFTLENNGMQIIDLKLSIVGEDGVSNEVLGLANPLDSGMVLKHPLTALTNVVGTINHIKIIPEIMVDGQSHYCISSAEEIDQILECP
ncbi:MAG: archaellin/type IV pilin N-terminal domain-containing protein [Candidatus Woesearchaeota archaeon]